MINLTDHFWEMREEGWDGVSYKVSTLIENLIEAPVDEQIDEAIGDHCAFELEEVDQWTRS